MSLVEKLADRFMLMNKGEASLVPLTSISFMPMRIASMSVPVWQVELSLVFLLAGIDYVRLFATRVFRANITLFGKEPCWVDIWRSMLKSDV
jgi:ABC-type Na+ efflux pump permease subunit